MANAVLLVVFDGLRPDMVGPATTPRLQRFIAAGTRFARARSVFPSETRVCSASVATGCYPGRHGLVANRFVVPGDPTRTVASGEMANLVALQQQTGQPVLLVPTLGQALHAAGRQLTVFSSGTTGQSWALNPDADAFGHVTLSAHGAQGCSAAGRALLARLPPPPKAAPARAEWIAEAYRTHILPDPPAASILWLCEPDSAGHAEGLGSAAQLAALARADAAFGRIVDDWRTGPSRDDLQIMVASDHGQVAVGGHVDVAAALAPGFPDCMVLPGSSGGVSVPGDGERIAAVAEFLTAQDWAGCVFAAGGTPLPDGVLPHAAALIAHPRAAQVLFTLRLDAGGASRLDGDLAVGAGTHGGLSAGELAIVLAAGGHAFGAGVSDWPSGLVDIAPTMLALLGLPGGAGMDGRVLAEGFADATFPGHVPAPESWEAGGPRYGQRLARTRLGRHVYLDSGVRLGG